MNIRLFTLPLFILALWIVSFQGEAAVPRFAFAVNSFNNSISQYIVDAKAGRLVPNGLTAMNHFPSAVAVHPSNRFVFATAQSTGQLQVFALDNASGRLSEIEGSPFEAKVVSPFAITFAKNGRFVYVAGRLSNNIMGFEFDVDNARLKPIKSMPAPTEQRARQMVVHPSGKYLYSVNTYSDSVSAFTIDQSSGLLTRIKGSPYSVGHASVDMLIEMSEIPEGITQGPYNIQVHPSGDYLFVPNWMSASISVFKVNHSNGSLELVKGSPFKSDPHPYDVAVSPDGRFLYSIHWAMNTIVGFGIDTASGTLKRLHSAGMNSLGQSPVDTWFDAHNSMFYVANYYTHNIASYVYDASDGSLILKNSTPARFGPRSFSVSYGEQAVQASSKILYSISAEEKMLFAHSLDIKSGKLQSIANLSLQGTPAGLAVDNVHQLVYVVTTDPDELHVYSLSQEQNLKPANDIPIKVPETPSSVAVGPNGLIIYISSAQKDRLLLFERHPVTGEIKEWPESPRTTNRYPTKIKIDPAGRFAFVLNEKSDSIGSYKFRSGLWPLLDQIQTPERIGKDNSRIVAMTTDPLGNFIFAADANNNEILSYWINTTTGFLEEAKESYFKTGQRPVDVEIHPSGRWAYVVNNTENNVYVFSVNYLFGKLEKRTQLMETLSSPVDMLIDASGRYAYLRYEGSGKISIYSIAETDGRLRHLDDLTLDEPLTDFTVDRRLQ